MNSATMILARVAGSSLRGVPRGLKPAAHRAFSLLEMIIAIVILGLGLIMVATMFPVAWNRARVLTEYTSQVAIIEMAHTTIDLLTRVDGLKTRAFPIPPEAGSFAGDLITRDGDGNGFLDTDGIDDDWIIAYGDTRVHALHLENVLVERPAMLASQFVPNRDAPLGDEHLPWDLERIALVDTTLNVAGLNIDPRDDCKNNLVFPTCDPLLSMFFNAQVRFASRVYPPMPADLPPLDELWYEALNTRRYAWAVFHRLTERTGPEQAPAPTPPQRAQELIDAKAAGDTTREFNMYYVALKRSQQAVRYARQDTDPAQTPDYAWPNREAAVAPAALTHEYDVLLPSPWRVQVKFPGPDDPNRLASADPPPGGLEPTGIPTEIEVNPKDAQTADFVVDMFQEGTWCIDEISGQIYRVTAKRLLGKDLTRAVLTLDREILIEDIDDGYTFPPDFQNGKLEPEELLRTVWVFPPPVQVDRVGGNPVFVGKQPVVAIETRTLTRSPR